MFQDLLIEGSKLPLLMWRKRFHARALSLPLLAGFVSYPLPRKAYQERPAHVECRLSLLRYFLHFQAWKTQP